MLSKNATDEDIKLTIKIVLTYCKTSPQNRYKLSFDGKEMQGSPFNSRDEISSFSIL
jgi:hypothetical protein